MGLDAQRLNGTLVDVAVYPPQESVYLMGHENEGSAALLFFFFLSRIIVHRGSLPHITLYFLDMMFNVTKAPVA